MLAAIRCTVCGASTAVRADAVAQRCDSCGAALVIGPTHAAAGEIERTTRARLDAIEPELERLQTAARDAVATGNLDAAYHYTGERVRMTAAIYRATGYYRLMGVETDDAIERMMQADFQVELQGLGIGASTPAPTPSGHDEMTRGLAERNFATALSGYAAMVTQQLEQDPRFRDLPKEEREQLHATSVRTFALGIPWVTDAELAQHGIAAAPVTRRPDGSAATTCIRCGAEIVLAQLVETITCSHCSTTFRMRLQGVDIYHARGHTDVTAADLAREQAMTSTDVAARLELGRQTVAGMGIEDPIHERELVFVYALQLGVPLPPAACAAMAAQLGLGAPQTCASCSTTIARAEPSRRCPLCTAR